MPRNRFSWSAAGLPLDQKNDSYAYRKNIAMLIDAGLSFDEINQAAKDLYEDNELGGVYLDNSKQKVWVAKDTAKKTEHKGYEIYARSLKITASDDSTYWEWKREAQPRSGGRSVDIEVARLNQVKWLEVRGKFSTIKLTANTTYKVSFILKATHESWNDNRPVTFRLYVPNMGRQEKQQVLQTTNDYKTYEVGQFENNRTTVGTIEFHMEQLSSDWKRGLTIKGVRIEPLLS